MKPDGTDTIFVLSAALSDLFGAFLLGTLLLVFFFDNFDLFFGLARGRSIRRVLAELVNTSSTHASVAFELLTIFVVADNGATEIGNGGGKGVGVVKLNLGILG